MSILPLIACSTLVATVLIEQSKQVIERTVHNSIYSEIIAKGQEYDTAIELEEDKLKNFSTSGEVNALLRTKNKESLQPTAQIYTNEVFNELSGWEGLYIADWDSRVLTHQSEDVIGQHMRDGDSLAYLRSCLLNAEGGVYNAGVTQSQVTGDLIVSLYVPIFEGEKPLGYVAGGIYVKDIIEKYADISSLGIDSAYMYLVSKNGIMGYHPNAEKIGQPVENAVVLGLVEDIKNREHPEPSITSYEYKGATKYAGYYVPDNNSVILVLTADRADVLKSCTNLTWLAIIINTVLSLLFGSISLIISLKIAKPIKVVAKNCESFALGDLSADFSLTSHVGEITMLFNNLKVLQDKVVEVISEIQGSALMISDNSDELKRSVESSVDSVSQISSTINEVAQGNTSLADSVSTQMASVEELGANIDESNEQITSMQDVTNNTVTLFQDANAVMNELVNITNQTKANIDSISEQSVKNVKAAEEINLITDAIRDITSQTNLLSLNASIEAARAGEAGKGFAIVAEEIRKLADTSAQQTDNIKAIVDALAETIDETNKISSNLVESANVQLTKLDTTSQMFDKVIAQVNDIRTGTGVVADDIASITSIKNNVTDIAEDLSAISEETSASSEEVAASAQMVHESMSGLITVADNLEQATEKLKVAVSYFK